MSAFQACHFIGMPECEVADQSKAVQILSSCNSCPYICLVVLSAIHQVILAQCAIYLARAPKSVEVYQAYANVKACLRNHKGPLPSVPLHLRNAPTRLMKDLGYAKGYKYNPAFSGPVKQEYLPKELQGIDFFTRSPTEA